MPQEMDKYKNKFTMQRCTFGYERILFGNINEGTTFQRDMKIFFYDLVGKLIQIYLHDLIFYSKC